jgi:ATP-dependent DNA ligase
MRTWIWSPNHLPLEANFPTKDRSPFINTHKLPERVVCEVAFAEWIDDEQLRQTTFLGWRDDRRLEEVVLEQPNGRRAA